MTYQPLKLPTSVTSLPRIPGRALHEAPHLGKKSTEIHSDGKERRPKRLRSMGVSRMTLVGFVQGLLGGWGGAGEGKWIPGGDAQGADCPRLLRSNVFRAVCFD